MHSKLDDLSNLVLRPVSLLHAVVETPRKAAAAAPTSTSIPRKFVDMLSPLLIGSKAKRSAASPAETPRTQTPGGRSSVEASSKPLPGKKPMASANVAADLSPLTSNAKKLNRAVSNHHTGLLDYVNKMSISDVFTSR